MSEEAPPSALHEYEDDELSDTAPPTHTRLDITASLFKDWSQHQKQDFCDTLAERYDGVTTTVHLSGYHLELVLEPEQIKQLVQSIGKLTSVTELFVFQGGSNNAVVVLTEELLATSLPVHLQVLMLWQFRTMPNTLAAAMRQHPCLSRVTLNLPCPVRAHQQLQWGCLDVYAMAFASMEHLTVLQIRCLPTNDTKYIQSPQYQRHQEESIITPEALALLLASTSIRHLYLENCGLLDDHMDVVAEVLPTNKTLTTLDVKGNALLTDDCLYTTGRLLPHLPPQMHTLDVSGVADTIRDDAGWAVAHGMAHNHTLLSLELEGTMQRFADEFDIPAGHSDTEWMQRISHQLRINRAYHAAATARTSQGGGVDAAAAAVIKTDPASFVEAVSAVSDNVSCIYHFLRSYPWHCNRLTVPTPHVEPAANDEDDDGSSNQHTHFSYDMCVATTTTH